MSIKHNCCIKTLTAGLRRRRRRWWWYIYDTNKDKDCDLLQDRPVLPSGRTPHDKQNRNCLEYSQNLVM